MEDLVTEDSYGPLLITGATGFIGSHAVPAFASSRDVHVLGRPDTDWSKLGAFADGVTQHTWDGNVESLIEQIATIRPAVVLHLATQFVGAHKPKDIDSLVESNIRFGAQLAEACAQLGDVAFLNVGTIWQHADSRDYAPTNLYAATKQAFADILRFYADFDQLRVLNLKLTDSFGPNDTRPKLWSLLIKTAASGEVLEMSPGEQLIEPTYIDDVVDALLLTVSQAETQTESWTDYRVTAGTIPLKEVVARFNEVTGSNVEVKWGAKPYRVKEMFEQWSYGEMLPGWEPKVSLDEGIARIWKAAQS